jgi:hypothetical protein
MKSFGPKKFQIPCTDQKVPFWQFFRQGRDGRALLVRPSRIPHGISRILFALGADEFLARSHFFKVQAGKITVCSPQFFCFSLCLRSKYSSEDSIVRRGNNQRPEEFLLFLPRFLLFWYNNVYSLFCCSAFGS